MEIYEVIGIMGSQDSRKEVCSKSEKPGFSTDLKKGAGGFVFLAFWADLWSEVPT